MSRHVDTGYPFFSIRGAYIETPQDTDGDRLHKALERAIGFQHRIEQWLGRVPWAAVYLAHELALDRDIANQGNGT